MNLPSAVILSCVLALVHGDVYMHGPRGSNNRLRGQSATRENNNRLFDSQNNNRGGYNVGDKESNAANSEELQYRMNYFQSGVVGKSELTIEWTNQHGCGGDEDTSPNKLNCNIVLQYMCQENVEDAAPDDSITFRNGQNPNTQNYNEPNSDDETKSTVESRRDNNVREDRGLHESWEWYDACYRRERNMGLFTADQDLDENDLDVSSAIYTRQNPDGDRSGYECPEERDYYPYWHPTPWRDIAILANDEDQCDFYTENSFNVKPYGMCVEDISGGGKKHWSEANNPTACTEAGGEWKEFYNYLELAPEFTTEAACLAEKENSGDVTYKWGAPYDVSKIVNHEEIADACFVVPPAVVCKPTDWSRVNHLGNGRDATPLNYTWELPRFPSNDKQRCVVRIRYNISTDDYDPFNTTSQQNEQTENNVIIQQSVIQQNPLVDIGADGQLLQLALNTDQTGRTFQDRGHVFFLSPRPDEIDDDKRMVNLNVRGKRGNIVQTFPAVEYDFIPNNLEITEDDLVHIQWTGSNRHNNQGPGGDGQTGDAGEGTSGTDRSNIAEILDADQNWPLVYDAASLYQNMDAVWNSFGNHGAIEAERKLNYALQLSSGGYYECRLAGDCGSESVDNKGKLNDQLNNAPASFSGMVVGIREGVYHYMCTRNNNFTNRSQKGKITVSAGTAKK